MYFNYNPSMFACLNLQTYIISYYLAFNVRYWYNSDGIISNIHTTHYDTYECMFHIENLLSAVCACLSVCDTVTVVTAVCTCTVVPLFYNPLYFMTTLDYKTA